MSFRLLLFAIFNNAEKMKSIMNKLVVLLATVAITGAGCEDDSVNVTASNVKVNWQSAADSSSSKLIANFWNASEKCFNYQSNGTLDFQYWPQAHGLDVMVDAYNRTGATIYKTTINDWYVGVRARNGQTFYNVFYDDMEWNALAMLRAYETLNDEKFKTAAMDLWTDIKTGWNDMAGGGIAWKKDQLYSKNACSNGPASIIASRMYRLFGDAADKQWAIDIYNWEKENLFVPASGIVYDNMDGRNNEITRWIFTYNQGTFLGAALELYKITGDKSYLNDAQKAADYTLSNLVNSNDLVLKSEGTGDGGLFKGVFVRYFTQLIMLPDLKDAVRKRYVQFLAHNGKALWMEGTDKQHVLFAPYWKEKPSGTVDLSVQLSGCMLLESLALLKENGFLE